MKNSLMLLLALIFVPAWAADATTASASEQSAPAAQTVPKHKAKKHEAKKTEKKAAANTPADTAPEIGCYKQTCGGVLGCFTRGCAATCSPC